jgi:hypothetical protein
VAQYDLFSSTERLTQTGLALYAGKRRRSSLLQNQPSLTTLFGLLFFTAILTLGAVSASGQWQNVPLNGIPRTKDGKPDLGAAAPRKSDGKPDFSGTWIGDYQDIKKYITADQVGDLAADSKPGEFPVQPWAEALTQTRIASGLAWPAAHCLPPGIPMLDLGAALQPLKIIQEPRLVVILYEWFGETRQIFMDGRTLASDVNPTWLGYSLGSWRGDELVVESRGFNGKTWIDVAGHPSTEALHITEHFRRRDFGHLDLQITIDDPKAYTKPWTVGLALHLLPDGDLLEFICNENEADMKHMVDK